MIRLDWNDDRWSRIYGHFLRRHRGRVTKREMELHLNREGVRIIRDPWGNGRWEAVEFDDERQLLLLLLKYGERTEKYG
jgi:hypothetical protein